MREYENPESLSCLQQNELNDTYKQLTKYKNYIISVLGM